MTTKIANAFQALYKYYDKMAMMEERELDQILSINPDDEDKIFELETLIKAYYENADDARIIKDLATARYMYESTKERVKDYEAALKKLPKTKKNKLARTEVWVRLNAYSDFVEKMEEVFEENNIKTMKGHSNKAPAKKCNNKVNKMVGNVKKYENSVRNMF